MRRMDWAACSPLPWAPGDSQGEKSTTGDKVITDVLSNDVLCKVFTHVTRDELCAGLPLTCQAFRSALRSSGELQRSLEHRWDRADGPRCSACRHVLPLCTPFRVSRSPTQQRRVAVLQCPHTRL